MKYKIPKYRARLVRDGASLRVPDARSAAEAVRAACCDRGDREAFCVLYLDACQNVIGAEVVAVGARSGCMVEPSTVFRGVVIAGASSVILGHNHPSRDCSPSRQDVEATALLQAAGKILGVPVLDHVIVTDDGKSFSFCEAGLLGG